MIRQALAQAYRLWREWRDRRRLVGEELIVEIQRGWLR